MANIDFPSAPTTGQIFTAGGKSWKFNGVAWRLTPSSSTPGIAASGRVTTYSGLAGLTVTGGETYLVEGDGMFYIYDATLGWPAQGSGISIYGTNYGVGTTFPVSPSTDDRFYRTDLHMMAFYNGANWLSEQEYEVSGITGAGSVMPWSISMTAALRWPVRQDYGIHIERIVAEAFVNSPSSSTQYYTVSFLAMDTSNASLATLATFDTKLDGINTWRNHDAAIGVTFAVGVARELRMNIVKTSTPGNIYIPASVVYRLVLG